MSDATESGQERVTELWLCEAHHVVLKPGKLYRFQVAPDCEKCEKFARAGDPAGDPEYIPLHLEDPDD